MSIGENIKRIRTVKKLTQKELASSLCVSAAAISQFEQSDNLRAETIKKIADALEVDISDLMPDDLTAPGRKRATQKPREVSEDEALQSVITLLDYAGCDIALSVDEMRRIMEITKELHKALINDFKYHSDYKIIK